MKSELAQEVAERLREVVASDFGGNWTVFAKHVGIPQGTMKPWLDGVSLPGGKHLAAMARSGIDICWLLTGRRKDQPEPQVVAFPDGQPVNDWVIRESPRLSSLDAKGQTAVSAFLDALTVQPPEEQTTSPPRKAAAGPARARRR